MIWTNSLLMGSIFEQKLCFLFAVLYSKMIAFMHNNVINTFSCSSERKKMINQCTPFDISIWTED